MIFISTCLSTPSFFCKENPWHEDLILFFVTFDPSPGALRILEEDENLCKFSPLTHQQLIYPHVKHVPGSFPWEGSCAAVTKLHLAFADRVILKREGASVNTLLLLLTPSHFSPPPPSLSRSLRLLPPTRFSFTSPQPITVEQWSVKKFPISKFTHCINLV